MSETKWEYQIQQLIHENELLLNDHPNLKIEGDFSEGGDRFFKNLIKIEKLRKLPVMLYSGICDCENQIIRPQYEITFCAWCHKEIKSS